MFTSIGGVKTNQGVVYTDVPLIIAGTGPVLDPHQFRVASTYPKVSL